MAVEARKSSINVEVGLKLGGGADVTAFDKLDNVSDIPDLGGAPEQIEVTAIGDQRRKYIAGIIESDELEFTCWYEADKFKEVQGPTKAAIGILIKDAEGKAVQAVVAAGTVSATLSGFGVGDALSYTMRLTVEDIQFPQSITIAEKSTNGEH